MNKTEDRDNATHGNTDIHQQGLQPPYCGTPSTPPCLAEAVAERRTRLILRLAGHKPGIDHLTRWATHVDAYLASALNAAIMLTDNSISPPDRRGAAPE